ncbi:DUF6279 family lipoprotein [Ramlibacter humi]|uniref:Lipoprotein n=1 Tax=Ramlibacter humi TaxID=2530451 RepID=A0A4Z0BLA8_9BURK|nr:DUF6279 family lipoprotein [Ramlibacter humi]TFY99047.1 hypothetical protein EZ216_15925 [Ramlibacter humi]
MSFLRLARFAAIIGLLSLSGALCGCSAIKLAYANLPQIAYWWLDGYVDFDDAQSHRVREDLARLHDWHRKQELPRFMHLLQKAEKMAMGDVTPEQVCALEPELRERLAALRERAEPMVAANAVLLTAPQLQHLEKKFARKNREYRADWVRLPPEELLDKRLKLVVERSEMVYGSLGSDQQSRLRELLKTSAYSPALVLAERTRQQQEILDVLRRLATQPVPLAGARMAVARVVDRVLQPADPEYRAHVDTLRQETCRTAAAVHNGTTPAQRDFAARRLRAWQRDLMELAEGR